MARRAAVALRSIDQSSEFGRAFDIRETAFRKSRRARRPECPGSVERRLDLHRAFRYSLRDRLPADDLALYLAIRADEPPCIDDSRRRRRASA